MGDVKGLNDVVLGGATVVVPGLLQSLGKKSRLVVSAFPESSKEA